MGLLKGGQDLLDHPGIRGGKIIALTDVRGDIVISTGRPPRLTPL